MQLLKKVLVNLKYKNLQIHLEKFSQVFQSLGDKVQISYKQITIIFSNPLNFAELNFSNPQN